MAMNLVSSALSEASGQGWVQFSELGLAFVLSSLIGLERELRHKSAGLRTHTLVGLAAALIMLVSKYGFSDVLVSGTIVLDPSRVAAQIVTGIGFIGGGLIFVRRDDVRGLTTAAIVWLTAAVGMACGAGLPWLAILVTAAHFLVVYGYTPVTRRLPRSSTARSELFVTFRDGREVMARALAECTRRGFSIGGVSLERGTNHQTKEAVSVVLQIRGTGSVSELTIAVGEIPGVLAVRANDVNETD